MVVLRVALFLFVVSLFGCGTVGVAPSVKVGERPYLKLTWNDFQLVDALDSGMSARTATYTRWSFEMTIMRSGGGYIAQPTVVTIESGMDNENSLRVRNVPTGSLDLLLAHEQLHYDMNELQAAELRTITLDEWGTGYGTTQDLASADIKAKIDGVVTTSLNELKLRNERYDSETAHGTIVAAQQRWADEIGAEID